MHGAPADAITDATLPNTMDKLVTEVMVGSVEHTRNGYDLNIRTYLVRKKLAFPAFSIAVSYMKTQVEFGHCRGNDT